MSEMRSRGACVITVATESEENHDVKDELMINIPPASELLAPVVAAVPLQLLAYYMAVERGCDVDMPKKLVRSVTVE